MCQERHLSQAYRGADMSLARPTSRFILFDGENISFDASLVIYIVLIFLQLLTYSMEQSPSWEANWSCS